AAARARSASTVGRSGPSGNAAPSHARPWVRIEAKHSTPKKFTEGLTFRIDCQRVRDASQVGLGLAPLTRGVKNAQQSADQLGHANEGSSSFSVLLRVSWVLGCCVLWR